MRYRRSILLSLCGVLCVISLAGWSRSRWASDEVVYGSNSIGDPTHSRRMHGFAHGGGDFAFLFCHSASPFPVPIGWRYRRLSSVPVRQAMPYRVVGLFGYGLVKSHPAFPRLRYRAVVLPYWLITVPTAFPFAATAWPRGWRNTRGCKLVLRWTLTPY
ncbi:MAG TPA: hypothetical protein VGR35_17110 [Tepidisphaeraceae bacterium]|nr:hypothetical protein [Tepidisphaeraceae bacterium]